MKKLHLLISVFTLGLCISAIGQSRMGPFNVAEYIDISGKKTYKVMSSKEFDEETTELKTKASFFSTAKRIFETRWREEGKIGSCPVDLFNPEKLTRKKVLPRENDALREAAKLQANYESNLERMEDARSQSTQAERRARRRAGDYGEIGLSSREKEEERKKTAAADFGTLLDEMYLYRTKGVRPGTNQKIVQ